MVCGPDEANRSFLKCRNAQLALTKSCKSSYIVYRDQSEDIVLSIRSIEFLKKFPPLVADRATTRGGNFLKVAKSQKFSPPAVFQNIDFLMVFGIFRGFKPPIFFACGDPNPSHGLSVVLQYLNLKKPCLWRAFGAWFLCETVFKRCFHQCRKALILFVNWFTPRADTTFGVFTSVGVRFYYSQNSFHRALTRF